MVTGIKGYCWGPWSVDCGDDDDEQLSRLEARQNIAKKGNLRCYVTRHENSPQGQQSRGGLTARLAFAPAYEGGGGGMPV